MTSLSNRNGTAAAAGVTLLLAAGSAAAQLVDFDSDELHSLPVGWISAMTHSGNAPQWQIERDDTSRGGGRVLAQISTDRTSQRFPLAIFSARNVIDGEVRVRFKAVSGRVDQAAGLVWRYTDEDNYYVVRANAREDNVVLYVENGERTSLAPVGHPGEYGVDHPVPAGVWNTLGVKFDGSTFAVYFRGEQLFRVEDSTFLRAGRVGLWTKADSVTYFDDFEFVPNRERLD